MQRKKTRPISTMMLYRPLEGSAIEPGTMVITLSGKYMST